MSRRIVACWCALVSLACLDVSRPPAPLISCEDAADCPAPLVCRPGTARCVAAAFAIPRCGDGIIDDGEACDDANDVQADECTDACTLATCGDGVTQAPEQCDDGNASDIDGCTTKCLAPRCGDGFLQAGERCDDGNDLDGDACAACDNARCGDGFVQPLEECDDGNTLNGDGCTNACTVPTCGDVIVQAPEECDDGNESNIDGCTNVCLEPRCGDGLVQGNEPCDDSNDIDTDGCIACQAARCGDGKRRTGVEVCDDGNLTSGDGCRADCATVEACGDGALDVGEACDDGNDNESDSCRSACVLTIWTPTVLTGLGPAGGGPTAIGIGQPLGVAVDRFGNVFFSAAHRVWKRTPAGTLTVFAGNGIRGFAGDGGLATEGSLDVPAGVAMDGIGNVFIADTFNACVRKVAPDGTLSTVAGNGDAGFSGDDGPATARSLITPVGVAVDGVGNLFIADKDDHRVRRVGALDGILSTVAGGGTNAFSGDGGLATAGSLSSPSGVAVDDAGNVWIADAGNHRVRRVAALDGRLSTVAGNGTAGFSGDGGPSVAGSLSFPSGVAVDGAGNVFIADHDNHRVRRIAPNGTLSTVAGGGVAAFTGDGGLAAAGSLNGPVGVAVDDVGNLFVADQANSRVRKVASSGTLSTWAGNGTLFLSGDGGPATAGSLASPYGVAVDRNGNVVIADTLNHRVRRVAALDGTLKTVAGVGSEGFFGDGASATAGALALPSGVGVDGDGNVFIADTLNHRVRRVAALDGTLSTVAGNGTAGFSGDGGPAIAGSLFFPAGVVVGAGGDLFIADRGNHRVRKVAPDGTLSTVAGNGTFGFAGDGGPATAGSLASPFGVAVDDVGNLFIADASNHRVRKVAPGGTLSTLAGNGTAGFSGDSGPAIAGSLAVPSGVVADGSGGVFIADTNNQRIRRVAPDGTLSTVAGGDEPGGAFATSLLPSPAALAMFDDHLALAAGARVFAVDLSASSVAVGAGYVGGFVADARARFSRLLADAAGVAFDADASSLYVSERANHTLRRIDGVDAADVLTWTIRTVGGLEGAAGFVDGVPLADARFHSPAGLAFDDDARILYVADSGNHVVRIIDVDVSLVTTFAGTPRTLGFFGDGDAATAALLFGPQAVALDGSGNVFIADTRNERVRMVDVGGTITTVIGDGTAGSSGVGAPARLFPLDEPLGVAVDRFGNLYVTSTVVLRQVTAGPDGFFVSGDDEVRTIYGTAPRETFPEDTTRCLTGVAVSADDTVHIVDRCAGLLIALERGP